jgi:hypothetical protein
MSAKGDCVYLFVNHGRRKNQPREREATVPGMRGRSMALVVEFQLREREPRKAARRGAAEIIILPAVRIERLPDTEFPEPTAPQPRLSARGGK